MAKKEKDRNQESFNNTLDLILYILFKEKDPNQETFNTDKGVRRASRVKPYGLSESVISTDSGSIKWTTSSQRIAIIREGIPYDAIETIGDKANLPIRRVLEFLEVPQTTYNKHKRERKRLSGRESELILVLNEVLDFGLEVFNQEEEKFQRWLKKPNPSLGGVSPESLFDSVTGIQEVRNALNRLEYGNMA